MTSLLGVVTDAQDHTQQWCQVNYLDLTKCYKLPLWHCVKILMKNKNSKHHKTLSIKRHYTATESHIHLCEQKAYRQIHLQEFFMQSERGLFNQSRVFYSVKAYELQSGASQQVKPGWFSQSTLTTLTPLKLHNTGFSLAWRGIIVIMFPLSRSPSR